jgi:hypothetical protein
MCSSPINTLQSYLTFAECHPFEIWRPGLLDLFGTVLATKIPFWENNQSKMDLKGQSP